MARKITSDYKRIYREYFGIKWDTKQLVIHHLDHNRKNNNINNLVLIPSKLHSKYHMCQSMFIDGKADILRVGCYRAANDGYQTSFIEGLFETKRKIFEYIELRDAYMYCIERFQKQEKNAIAMQYVESMFKLLKKHGFIQDTQE